MMVLKVPLYKRHHTTSIYDFSFLYLKGGSDIVVEQMIALYIEIQASFSGVIL